ncbi:hypothetical protein ACJZ2D_011132 [Fusarium nematophilum]
MFVGEDSKLHTDTPSNSGNLSYQSDIVSYENDQGLYFVHEFTSLTRLVGYSRAIIYLSCNDHDYMDVFVTIRKADRYGVPLVHVNVPLSDLGVKSVEELDPDENCIHDGPSGILRASHRECVTPDSPGSSPPQQQVSGLEVRRGYLAKIAWIWIDWKPEWHGLCAFAGMVDGPQA